MSWATVCAKKPPAVLPRVFVRREVRFAYFFVLQTPSDIRSAVKRLLLRLPAGPQNLKLVDSLLSWGRRGFVSNDLLDSLVWEYPLLPDAVVLCRIR
jgi:hypothetical protein